MAQDTSVLEWFRRRCPPGAHFSASRGFYYPRNPLAAAQARQDRVARQLASERLRLTLPPALAALAAKLDQAMR